MEKHFHVNNCIGRGTFSTVFEVSRLTDNKKFALKKIFLANIQEGRTQLDSLNEINLLLNIEHPNIIRLINYEYIHAEKTLNLVLELANNGDLSNFISNHIRHFTLVSEPKIWKFTHQLSSGLDYLHSKRIIHKDLKPANIFLTLNEDVKIGDFGMGEIRSNNAKQCPTTVLGTPYYMSPERLLQKPYSFNCDVWSLGCVIYEGDAGDHAPLKNLIWCVLSCIDVENVKASLQSPFFVNKLDINFLIKRIVKCDYPPLPSDVFSTQLNAVIRNCLMADDEKRSNAKDILDIAKDMLELYFQK